MVDEAMWRVVWTLIFWGASLVAQLVKNPPAVQEVWVRSLGPEDPLEKGMATHSSILAWRIPWTEEPGGLQSVGLQRAWHDWATFTFCCFFPWCHCDCRYRFYLFVVIVNTGVAKNRFWKPDLQYQPNWGSPQLHLSPPSSKWRMAVPVWIQSQVEKEDKYSLSFFALAPEVFS